MANNLDNVDLAFKYYDTIMNNTFRGLFELIRIWKNARNTPENVNSRESASRNLYNLNHAMAIVIHDRILNGESHKGIRRNTRV